jgi:murein DD-endopeptidase
MTSSFFGKKGVPWVLLACSIVLNIVLLVSRKSEAPKAVAKAAPVVAQPVQTPPPPAPPSGPQVEWQQLSAQVKGSLEGTFSGVLGGDVGPRVAATFARLFVWDVNLRTDLSPKDGIDLVYRETGPTEYDIAVARLQLAKTGKVLKAYRFQAPGDKFASWWNENGVEIPYQVKNTPIRDYQQIISLVGDGRNHKGVDFKAPVGTEVVSPFAGKVLRSNWKFAANGNCLEIQYSDGTLAKFLHLSANRVQPGDTVEAGQVIALSGNTGHSMGPHLHYQLEQGPKVIDPLQYHGTVRRELDASAKVQLQATVRALDEQIAPKTAGL